ncbi:hypothetical protein KGM_203339 [Danaus plexippus plexippus]|uniref:Uncharacterized protein n=1 Tax=Danaus plexippus plexippus TaxID=278856 RepID=A0A212EQL8_DANPL|nr:hypothetical protein KGM_203339 [Danaus plexippus plexippus]
MNEISLTPFFGTTGGRHGDEDTVDITTGPREVPTTPTSHGTFQLYDHGRSSNASANCE